MGETEGLNFNPRAPCGARLQTVAAADYVVGISTHAPLAGRDENTQSRSAFDTDISTHAPLAGRDAAACMKSKGQRLFQPTRPLRGATFRRSCWRPHRRNFNPRAPCGARPRAACCLCRRTTDFNPRAPCGARRRNTISNSYQYLFQPTRPLRGATNVANVTAVISPISTHAPLAGRDRWPRTCCSRALYFNPRAPCGARRSW